MTDMQVRGSVRSLSPGDPLCAPAPAVLSQALVQLLRLLLASSGRWASLLSALLLHRLRHAGQLADLIALLGVAKDPSETDGSPVSPDNKDSEPPELGMLYYFC